MRYLPLTDSFFKRDTIKVAKELLGKVIIRRNDKNKFLSGKIVEVEAYMGDHDPACHAYQKVTGRSSILYEEGGTIYVYFIYGNYYCFNIVTETKGTGSAVLIRAVEPLEGIEIMKELRPKVRNIHDLTNGPSKFCMAFDIDKKFNGKKLTKDGIFISNPLKNEKFEIETTKRIGINTGKDFPYRFFIKDNPFVTKHKLNK
ncbi:MAG: DNA-3-methyladenine glycosylase [Ignavibacteriae bacterium]|nr:DNA-3-methyladenine glycosylase [Ignavibacteriota bacterium]